MNTTLYMCHACGYISPRLPHAVQICPHCQMDEDQERETTVRWAEIVVSMLIGLMMGVIVAKSFL